MKDNKILIFSAVFLALTIYLSSILMPFISSFVIAYFLKPFVNYFEKRRIPRIWAVSLVFILFLLILFAILFLTLPIIYHQLWQILNLLPQYFKIFQDKNYPQIIAFFNKYGIYLSQNFGDNLNNELLHFAKVFSIKIFGSTLGFVNILSIIFIMPIIVFYLLKDWDLIAKNIMINLPRNYFFITRKIAKEIDLSMSQYLRGQLFVCLIMAFLYAISLTIADLDFGFAIGFFTGILTFIPYLGALSGLVFAIIFAIIQDGFLLNKILIILSIFAFLQIFEANILTPKLIGKKMGLHPILIIFAMFVFGYIFGFFGILFAMPLTAIFSVLIKNLLQDFSNKTKLRH